MTEFEKTIAINLRRAARILFRKKDRFEASSENCDDYTLDKNPIASGLRSAKPFAVSRFGYSELRSLLTFLHIQEKGSNFKKMSDYISGEKVEPWWHKNTIKIITHNAGVFPNNVNVIELFCKLLLQDISEIDVLGSWLGGERVIRPLMPTAKFVHFDELYHFMQKDPWTNTLANKKVLVVHPFSKSIQNQYQRKEKIFSGVHTLPDFELITYKAVQSIAGNRPKDFENWFQALDAMKFEISNLDFEIAILGCGAYGMPLASFVKRDLGKKAIHLGGNTQILFGIKGSRWDSDPAFNQFMNQYWVRPLPEEMPVGHQTIDNNCYW